MNSDKIMRMFENIGRRLSHAPERKKKVMIEYTPLGIGDMIEIKWWLSIVD